MNLRTIAFFTVAITHANANIFRGGGVLLSDEKDEATIACYTKRGLLQDLFWSCIMGKIEKDQKLAYEQFNSTHNYSRRIVQTNENIVHSNPKKAAESMWQKLKQVEDDMIALNNRIESESGFRQSSFEEKRDQILEDLEFWDQRMTKFREISSKYYNLICVQLKEKDVKEVVAFQHKILVLFEKAKDSILSRQKRIRKDSGQKTAFTMDLDSVD